VPEVVATSLSYAKPEGRSQLCCLKTTGDRYTHDDKQDGQGSEAHELDGLATPGINEKEGNPVTGDKPSNGKDDVSDTDIVETLVDIESSAFLCGRSTEFDGTQDDGAVKSKAVERDLETSQMTQSRTKQRITLTSRANQE
jgi:hypothetical protein